MLGERRLTSFSATARKPRKPECQSLGLLARLVFLGRAFTTCWWSDLPDSLVELAFGRDWDLQPLGSFLLRLALVGHRD
jgi:hypothetical protein